MAKNRTTHSFLLSATAACVASCLLLVTIGDAFVSSVPTSVRATAPWQARQLATPTGSTFVSPADQKLSIFRTAASAALLCLAATRLIKGKSQKSSVVRKVVIRLNAGATAVAEKPPVDLPPKFEEPVAIVETLVETIVDTPPSITRLPELISLDSHTPSLTLAPATSGVGVASLATASAATTLAANSACLCGRLRSARFAAGARHAQHRHARRASSKASRRAVGRHLCERAVTAASPSSFDASKTRTKIQLGLRVSSCMRSESGRESKLSSGVEGSEMGTCLNFVAHDLKVYMLDHGSALTANSSNHVLELQHAQLLRKHGK